MLTHERHCATSIGGPCDCDRVRERQYSGLLFAAQAVKVRRRANALLERSAK